MTGEMDAPIHVNVAAYLDCEHYIFLHRGLTDSVEVVAHEGLKVTVRQSWKALGLELGHFKTGTYIPPSEFHIEDVRPSPWWIPSIHHVVGIETHLKYWPIPERDSTGFSFDVELDLPFWLYPFRKRLEALISRLHDQQVEEDIAMIKRRERLFGRGNISIYLADHQFLYHKKEFLEHYGKAGRSA
jgi:hypothetical protein